MIKINKFNIFLTARRLLGILIVLMGGYLAALFCIKFIFYILYVGTTLIDGLFKFLVRWEVKANRRTATGILRAYFEKNNIADGEDFEIQDYRKFLEDEREAYRKEFGINDVFQDYGKFAKYVKNKYLKRK